MGINLRSPVLSFGHVYPLTIYHPISFFVFTFRMTTTLSKLAGRIRALATTVVPVILTNVWTAPRRTHMCARLLTAPSLSKNKLQDVRHRILIVRPTNRCSLLITVPFTSYAMCQ